MPCDGYGWADEEYSFLSMFCYWCAGSGLEEHTADSIGPEDINARVTARYESNVERLSALVADAMPGLAVVA